MCFCPEKKKQKQHTDKSKKIENYHQQVPNLKKKFSHTEYSILSTKKLNIFHLSSPLTKHQALKIALRAKDTDIEVAHEYMGTWNNLFDQDK